MRVQTPKTNPAAPMTMYLARCIDIYLEKHPRTTEGDILESVESIRFYITERILRNALKENK